MMVSYLVVMSVVLMDNLLALMMVVLKDMNLAEMMVYYLAALKVTLKADPLVC